MKLTSEDLIGAFQSCGATWVMGHEVQIPHPCTVECKVLNALRTPCVQNSRGDGSAILGTVHTTVWNFWEFILGVPCSKGHWLTRRQPETSELDGRELGKISSKKEVKRRRYFDQKNGDTMPVFLYLSCAGETTLIPCCPSEQSGEQSGDRHRLWVRETERVQWEGVRVLWCHFFSFFNCTSNPLSLLITLLSSLYSPGQCGERLGHQRVLWLELLWAALLVFRPVLSGMLPRVLQRESHQSLGILTCRNRPFWGL